MWVRPHSNSKGIVNLGLAFGIFILDDKAELQIKFTELQVSNKKKKICHAANNELLLDTTDLFSVGEIHK